MRTAPFPPTAQSALWANPLPPRHPLPPTRHAPVAARCPVAGCLNGGGHGRGAQGVLVACASRSWLHVGAAPDRPVGCGVCEPVTLSPQPPSCLRGFTCPVREVRPRAQRGHRSLGSEGGCGHDIWRVLLRFPPRGNCRLDALLYGGAHTGEVLELVGPSASGKTQLVCGARPPHTPSPPFSNTCLLSLRERSCVFQRALLLSPAFP
jgi:hypothetical protein